MKDRLKDLKIEIEQLEKQNKIDWLEFKRETQEKLSNSLLSKLFSKKSNVSSLVEIPLKFIIKELAECILEQTNLMKPSSNWSPLIRFGMEIILPKLFNAISPSKDE